MAIEIPFMVYTIAASLTFNLFLYILREMMFFIKYWKEISRIAIMDKRPFAYEITPRGGIKRLN
jgi:hypothetical protein